MKPGVESLYKKCRDWSLEKYVRGHLLQADHITPLAEEAYEVFQKNFKTHELVNVVSTAAHVGIIQWDLHHFISETVLANFLSLISDGAPIPVLPVDSIPFTNSTHPGAIDLSNLKTKDGQSAGKYSFRGRTGIYVSHAPPVSKEEIDAVMKNFKGISTHFPTVDPGRFSLFCEWLQKIPSCGKSFTEQAMTVSSGLWPWLFGDEVADKVKPLWNVLYEDLELYDENLFADRKSREALLGLEKKYDFWCHAPNYHRGLCKCGMPFDLALREDGGKAFLDGRCNFARCGHGNPEYSVEVNDLPGAIKRKEVMDALFMRFYKLWALTGVEAAGGCGQIEYLAKYKEGFVELLKKTGRKEDAEKLSKRVTNRMITSVFTPLNKDGTPKSGTQTLLEGGLTRDFLESLAKMRFGNLLELEDIFIDSFLWGRPADYKKALSIAKEGGLKSLIF